MALDHILEVKQLHKYFGSVEVLKGIDFSLQKGEALAMIGASGSGKTTLLRCLNFLEKPTSGKILVKGEIIFDSDDTKLSANHFLNGKSCTCHEIKISAVQLFYALFVHIKLINHLLPCGSSKDVSGFIGFS